MRDYIDGNTYINHLLAEHRRLHRLLQDASDACRAGSGAAAAQADLALDLRNIQREMEQHFAEEEAGGCLEEAVSRCPRISGAAEHVKHEHPMLLKEIERLIGRATQLHDDQERHEFQQDLFAFCRRLHAHEAAENSLLLQGFGMAVNGDDASTP